MEPFERSADDEVSPKICPTVRGMAVHSGRRVPLNADYGIGCMSSMRLPNGSLTYTRS